VGGDGSDESTAEQLENMIPSIDILFTYGSILSGKVPGRVNKNWAVFSAKLNGMWDNVGTMISWPVDPNGEPAVIGEDGNCDVWDTLFPSVSVTTVFNPIILEPDNNSEAAESGGKFLQCISFSILKNILPVVYKGTSYIAGKLDEHILTEIKSKSVNLERLNKLKFMKMMLFGDGDKYKFITGII
jgi:hypothetical protein